MKRLGSGGGLDASATWDDDDDIEENVTHYPLLSLFTICSLSSHYSFPIHYSLAIRSLSAHCR